MPPPLPDPRRRPTGEASPDRKHAVDLLFQTYLNAIEVERRMTVSSLKENEVDNVTQQLISRLNTATNNIAARLQSLVDKANNAGQLTATEIDDALSPIVANLEAMGSDPSNPVPDQPPAPVEG